MIRTVRLAGVFLAGSALSRIVAFLILPVVTSYLSPRELGIFDLSTVYISVVSAIVFCDVWVAAMRMMVISKTEHERESWLSNSSAILLISILIFSTITVVIQSVIAVEYLWLIWAMGVTAAIREFYSFVTRGSGMNIAFVTSGIMNTLILAGATLFFLVVENYDYSALFWGAILGNLVQCLTLEVWVGVARRFKLTQLRLSQTAQIIRFILPLGINALAFWLILGTGRIVIANALSLEDNGLFGVASRFGAIVTLLGSVITLAWQESAFLGANQARLGFYQQVANKVFLSFGIGATFTLPVIAVLFPRLVDHQFVQAYQLIPGFVLSAALMSFSAFIGNMFYALEMNGYLLLTTIASLTVVLAITYPAVRIIGMQGANLALAIAVLVGLNVRLRILAKTIPFRLRVRRQLFIFANFALMSIAFMGSPIWVVLLLATVQAAVFMIIYRQELSGIWRAVGLKYRGAE